MATGDMQLAERNVSADGSIVVEYEDDPRPPVHRGHAYFITTPDIGRVPGATTVLGAYDKGGLVHAAANVTLTGVATVRRDGLLRADNVRKVVLFLDGKGWLSDDAQEDETGVVAEGEAIKTILHRRNLRHHQVWGAKADRGTFVHAVNQAWIEDGTVPNANDIHDEYRPFIQAFGSWVTEHEPEFLTSEVIVGSAVNQFAGRYDAKGVLTSECALKACGCHDVIGQVGRWDWKTSSALYPENMAQLDLYEVAAMEMGEDQADYRAPLRLGKDGTYEFSVSKLPVGASLGMVAGYKARQNVEELHKHLNPRRKRG